MIKLEHTDVYGFEAAVRGLRNPMNSWDKSDSCEMDCNLFPCDGCAYEQLCEERYPRTYEVGENDLALMRKLAHAGDDHGKFARFINVSVDITAPLYWWKEFDTYKVGTVSNSCSTMHRLTSKPFDESDFSFERLVGNASTEYFDVVCDFEEKWEDVLNHENYAVSNKGRVWSKKRDKILTPSVNSSNYKKVVLDGKNLYVHRLVAQAFCQKTNGAEEVNHIDGNKWNNNYSNLEWVSKSENAKHAFDLGLRTISGYTRYKVSKSAHRFTSDEIENIKQMYCDGMSKKEIADIIGCCSSIICNILNGETYREIEMTPYDTAKLVLDYMNELRNLYLKTKNKDVWYALIQLLPSSYNQRRTVQLNYQVLNRIYHARKNHKLDEWHEFCAWIEKLPYFKEIYLEGVNGGDND